MLWLKAFHIVFVVTWFAGLFYLPRLFVYYAMSDNEATRSTLVVMQRKLLGITHIGGVLAILFGVVILIRVPAMLTQPWMVAKLALVALLIAYHVSCGVFVKQFAKGLNSRSHVWFRWYNEAPSILLIAVVILAVLKPF